MFVWERKECFTLQTKNEYTRLFEREYKLMQSNNNGFLDILTIFSLGLQMAVYEQTQRQATTDDLMRELQKQDREYFERILGNQNRILSILSQFDDMSA